MRNTVMRTSGMKLLGFAVLGLLAQTGIVSCSTQLNLGGETAFSPYDEGLFTPLGDLSVLSSTEFTALAHPAFPRHNVRIKQSHFCDGSVRYELIDDMLSGKEY